MHMSRVVIQRWKSVEAAWYARVVEVMRERSSGLVSVLGSDRGI